MLIEFFQSSLFFYRVDTHVKIPQERPPVVPVRESIHTEAILNIYPVDASNFLSGSQDRVRHIFVHLIVIIIIITCLDISSV
jgi:hypothetical protein